MPAEEFLGWQELERIEPWGERRLDFIAGMITAGIRNAWLGKNQDPYKPQDFIHNWDMTQEIEAELKGRQQAAIWQSFEMRYNIQKKLKQQMN